MLSLQNVKKPLFQQTDFKNIFFAEFKFLSEKAFSRRRNEFGKLILSTLSLGLSTEDLLKSIQGKLQHLHLKNSFAAECITRLEPIMEMFSWLGFCKPTYSQLTISIRNEVPYYKRNTFPLANFLVVKAPLP
jgi:hypothetical protein